MNPEKKETLQKALISNIMDSTVKIAKALQKDSRYDYEAYNFVMASLGYTISKLKERRHLSGRELLHGIRVFALKQYGPMARTVLEHWGVKTTGDFGEIVFNLIGVELLSRRAEDTKEEFHNVYDFKSAFDDPYLKSYKPRFSLTEQQ